MMRRVLNGDYIRWRIPAIEGIGARHLTVNRNKKSVELNLKTAEADVIIESFRPGVMQPSWQTFVVMKIAFCKLKYKL